jgi:hypothetical protein
MNLIIESEIAIGGPIFPQIPIWDDRIFLCAVLIDSCVPPISISAQVPTDDFTTSFPL